MSLFPGIDIAKVHEYADQYAEKHMRCRVPGHPQGIHLCPAAIRNEYNTPDDEHPVGCWCGSCTRSYGEPDDPRHHAVGCKCNDCDGEGNLVTTADKHDCRDEAPCYGHPDCKYALCDGCGVPNGMCRCP